MCCTRFGAVDRVGHYYQFVRESKTWDNAVAAATSYSFQGMPGHLVTIQDQAENAFVRSLLSANAEAWIDGSDSSQEGTWKFTQGPQTGAAMPYTNWLTGRPNGGNSENNLILEQASGQWEDRSKFGSFYFVIEYECASCSPSESCLLCIANLTQL
jgi:hypothetical protein